MNGDGPVDAVAREIAQGAMNLAQTAIDANAAHSRQCARMWSAAFFTLLVAIIGYLLATHS